MDDHGTLLPPAEADPPAVRTARFDTMSGPALDLLGKCVAHISDAVLITEATPFEEPGPRIVFANAAFERMTGYGPAEFLGKTPRILQGPKTDRNELRRIGEGLRRWEVVRTELINYTKDGREFEVEMDIVPVADASGKFTHWVSIQRDVTERKRAEAQARLRETQRAESLGTLAAGIAHDFNNIVAAILGNVAIARQELAEGQSALPNLEQISKAGLRARSLVQQILSYSRRQPQAFAAVDLRSIVKESTDLLRAVLPASVTLNVRLCDEPLVVSADAGQLNQVLMNLGTNAWHAMRGNPGRIDVELDVREGSADGSTPAKRQTARIRFTDDGCGMDAATCARIFEPYYTTKPVGQGTGLGLSVVWGIVAAHGAAVEVASSADAGTTFDLLFPLLFPLLLPVMSAVPRPPHDGASALPASEASHPPARSLATGGAGKHVLVVDDDEVTGLMLEGLLVHQGYRVTLFDDPSLAIAAVALRPGDFDAVVTDFNMPGLSGLEFAKSVLSLRPLLPVMIGSGYVNEELQGLALELGVVAVFDKQFATEHLGDLLRDALQKQAAQSARPTR